MPTVRLLPIVLALLSSAIWGGAAAGAQARQPPASESTKPSTAWGAAPVTPDIQFYLAHGETDACGRGCSEWIVAEGKINANAGSRLRRLLAKLGGRRPPIYFHSPGGSVAGSMELGRLIRLHSLEVSVAHTIALCSRDKALEASCDAQKLSGQAIEAAFDTTVSQCNSGCVLALAGGATRFVPPGVKLGIHDVGFEQGATLPRGVSLGEAKRAAHAGIRSYLREMGIDEALLAAMLAVPFESKRWIGRNEIASFGIDRRERGESVWQFSDTRAPAIKKSFFVHVTGEQPEYVDAQVRLDCGAGQAIRLTFVREHSASEPSDALPHSMGLSIGGRRLELSYRPLSKELDLYSVLTPASTFGATGDSTTLEIPAADFGRPDESISDITLAMDGFARAYATLRKRCDQRASNVIALGPAKPLPFPFGVESQVGYPAVAGHPGAPASLQAAPIPPVQPADQADAAVAPPPEREAAQRGCALQLTDVPERITGRVVGFVSDERATAGTKLVEAELGAKVSPAYLSLQRARVEAYPPRGNWATMAAIPRHLSVRVGDVVELESRHRDASLPCNFIPWTIHRLAGHVE